jgi:hypothetical protein
MSKRGWGLPPDESIYYGVSMLCEGRDARQQEHLNFLAHHPGFQQAIPQLAEDLEDTVGARDAKYLSEATPEDVPYPLVKFAEEWGLTVSLAATLASARRENVDSEMARAADAHAIVIWQTPTAITIRIPRPIISSKVEAVKRFLGRKSMRGVDGPVEKAWNLASGSRTGRSKALEAALPWFDRWNADKNQEPAAIWREVLESQPKLTHANFVAQLTRVWERMRVISPEGIREDRPSKRRG